MAVTDLLKSCPIFFDLFDNEIESVVKKCKVFTYDPGDYIAKEGDPSREIMILLDGEVSSKKQEGDQLFLVEQFKKGSVFGFLVLIEEKNFTTHIIAEKESHILKIPFQHLLSVFDSDARTFGIICLNLCRILAMRFEKLNSSVFQEASRLRSLMKGS